MKVGYLGVPGSYSEAALQKECAGMENLAAIGYGNFPDLVNDLADKQIEMAVIPVENSTTGFIARSSDLFRHKPIVAVADRYEPVQHTLWGIPGSKLSEITDVFSHPEALSQCDTFFAEHPHLRANGYADTAQSAAFIRESNLPNQAAIASPRAGELYGLEPLMKNIQTENTNTTRFYIMKHQDDAELAGHQLSLYVEARHEPGALSKILQAFGLLQCNLLALNARPIPEKPFAYGFFMEIDMSKMTVKFETLWEILQQASEYIQVLGQFVPKENIYLHSENIKGDK